MNPALLYRPRGRWMSWIALACAAVLHVAAVALAKGKPDKAAMQNCKPPGVDVQVVELQPDQLPPEESIIIPQPPQLLADEEKFAEETRTPRPVRPRKNIRLAPFVRGTPAPFGSVKAWVMYAPRLVYPYEARRQRITGSGRAVFTVDPTSGNVTDVVMVQSCSSAILDNATLEAFRRWRFKSGTASTVQVPITYTLTGASY